MADWCSGKNLKHRWAGRRLNEQVANMSVRQKGWIEKHGFATFLNFGDFTVHARLTEWIMQRINPDIFEFQDGGKVITFDRTLAIKILGLHDGNTPVALSGRTEDVRVIKELYKIPGQDRFFIPDCIELMNRLDGEEDEDNFMRSFMLFLLATVLTLGTGNYVNLEYLPSLVDVADIKNLDWATHVITKLMTEIKRYQALPEERRQARAFYIGECLPLLTIAYMDHIKLPTSGLKMHAINYGVPRVCHVSHADFEYVARVDKQRLVIPQTYGSRDFRDKKDVIYYVEPNQGDAAAQDSASLDEWIRMSASSSQGSQMPSNIQSVIHKYVNLWEKYLDTAVSLFSKLMKNLLMKRTSDMISEIREVAARDAAGPSNQATDDPNGNQSGAPVGGSNVDIDLNPNASEHVKHVLQQSDSEHDGRQEENSNDVDDVVQNVIDKLQIGSEDERGKQAAVNDYDYDIPSCRLFSPGDPQYFDSQEYREYKATVAAASSSSRAQASGQCIFSCVS